MCKQVFKIATDKKVNREKDDLSHKINREKNDS
jgi:hypothetical protein